LEKIGKGSISFDIKDPKAGYYTAMITSSEENTLKLFWNNNPNIKFLEAP
jgi:hypothetical protein